MSIRDEDKVIFYTYSSSPMFHKIRNVLILKRIPYFLVTVPIIPPRLQLLDHLGITYRRIPVLAIGNDLFFDTSLMVTELEKRFTPENGHPALLETLGGLQEAASFWWSDRTFFSTASGLLPGKALTPALIKDRSEFSGTNLATIDQRRPAVLSMFRSQLAMITKQLETSKSPFLLSTSTPSYIDVALYSLIAWVQGLKTAPEIITSASTAPLALVAAMTWFETVGLAIKSASRSAPAPQKISAEEAARIVLSSPPAPNSAFVVDATEPLVVAGWLQKGARVSVTPADTGRIPQFGTLVGLNDATVSIRVQAPNNGSFIAHFPRLGYVIKADKSIAKL